MKVCHRFPDSFSLFQYVLQLILQGSAVMHKTVTFQEANTEMTLPKHQLWKHHAVLLIFSPLPLLPSFKPA